MIPKLTSGSDFAGLTQYLVQNREHEVLSLRGVSTIEHAATEMQIVAASSKRVRKPVMHVSFAAAIEDGPQVQASWLTLADNAEAEFGLKGHQRVVVRHTDKHHDHVHVFWCTVSSQTGRTPPKQWFRKRDAPLPELGQRALDPNARLLVGADHVVQGAFSRMALVRLMSVCRRHERTHGLRQLRDPAEMAKARAAGAARPARAAAKHREERTGRPPVTVMGDQIRAALDRPDYPSCRRALNAIGLDLEPVTRPLKDGTLEYRGLVIVDLGDRGNRAPASAFDLPDCRYGLRQVEGRHQAHSLTIERYWPERDRAVATGAAPVSPNREARAAFDALRTAHRVEEARKAAERRHIAARHKKERRQRRDRLLRLRKERASRLPPSERRAFLRHFTVTIRPRIWSRLQERQARESAPLKRGRLPSWHEFLADHVSPTAPFANGHATETTRPKTVGRARVADPNDVPNKKKEIEDGDDTERGRAVHPAAARKVGGRHVGSPKRYAVRIRARARTSAPERVCVRDLPVVAVAGRLRAAAVPVRSDHSSDLWRSVEDPGVRHPGGGAAEVSAQPDRVGGLPEAAATVASADRADPVPAPAAQEPSSADDDALNQLWELQRQRDGLSRR